VFRKNISGGPWIVFVVFARGLAALPQGIVSSLAMYIMAFFVGENYKIPDKDRVIFTVLSGVCYAQ
jgi:hypothetical protein